MSSSYVRIVLDDDVVENDLTALTGANNWWLKDRIARSGDQPWEYIYGTGDENTNLHWIEDHKVGVKYIVVNGPASAKVASVLRDNLEHFPADYIQNQARKRDLKAD